MSDDLTLIIRVLEGYGFEQSDRNSLSDPLVLAKFKGFAKIQSARTTAVMNTANPVWNQELKLRPKTGAEVLLIKVYDKDIGKDDLLGLVEIPLGSLSFTGGFQDSWFQLTRKVGFRKWSSSAAHVHIQLWCGPASAAMNLPPPNYCQAQMDASVFGQNQTHHKVQNVGSSLNPVIRETTTTSAPSLRTNNGLLPSSALDGSHMMPGTQHTESRITSAPTTILPTPTIISAPTRAVYAPVPASYAPSYASSYASSYTPSYAPVPASYVAPRSVHQVPVTHSSHTPTYFQPTIHSQPTVLRTTTYAAPAPVIIEKPVYIDRPVYIGKSQPPVVYEKTTRTTTTTDSSLPRHY